MCRYQSEISHPEEAIRLLELALKICRSAGDSHDVTEYQLRIYRGRIHAAFVMRDRDEYYKNAELSWGIETARYQKSQSNSQRLAAAAVHMGIAHNFQVLYREAIPFLEESINVRRKIPGFSQDWLFSPYYQLAHAYFHLGQDEQAVSLLETAISDRIKALGENDRFSMRQVIPCN